MEEEIFDEINDCYQYMKDWFKYPHRSLDESGFHWYGSFIFFEYIEQHMGGTNVIRKIIEASVKSNSRERDGSHLAIDEALKTEGYSFQQALNGMSIANQIMSSTGTDNYSYEEAQSYPVEGPTILETINFQIGNQDTVESSRLARFASQYVQIVSQKPVLVNLYNRSGSFSDLRLNAILKMNDNSYKVISSPSMNIDPINLQSIHLSIVSQDTTSGNWDYFLTVEDGESGTNITVPEEFILKDPYPNPFNGMVRFSIYTLNNTPVTIDIIDLNGRRIIRLHSGNLPPGNHTFTWNGIDDSRNKIASGIYYIKASGKITEEWKAITYLK